MDLFDRHRQDLTDAEAPLAARMRPQTLDEFVGQAAIIGQGRLLRRAIQADQLSSLIFYGPPGTGKTTLARIIANTTKAHFIAINAVLAGVKEIRDAIATAQDKRGQHSQRTILFVDEVHRFNKSQQDALLPWVENGTVILIGATTENPYFEVNKALVSRSRIFQLKPLNEEDLKRVVEQTLSDRSRGYGDRSIQLDSDALNHLVNVANGDARALLNALELAVETTPSDASGTICISLSVAEESIQRRAVLYDKEGDAHFDTISAFIKSLRGSDADAALYWLARMVYAGEDPRFIFRRMVILAGEDVGLADPNAIVIVNACAEAFDRVGMPEGRYPLAQAALYLATAPKSNSVMGFFDALSAIEHERESEVPLHLRDSSRDKQGFGHGSGYLYPHSYREHWVEQQYLPGSLQGQVFYQPSDQGFEAQIRTKVSRQREAQLAALVEGIGVALPEGLTMSPADSTLDRWMQRTLSQVGEKLGSLRDRVFDLAAPQRHHLILDLNATSGLLTWEAIRQVPEGGVYACVQTQKDYDALTEQAETLSELTRPVIVHTQLTALSDAFSKSLKFDRILGRNALQAEPDKAIVLAQLTKLLQPDGVLVLAEAVPRRAQRLYQLLDRTWLDEEIYDRLVQAEEAIYAQPFDPKVNWDIDDLQLLFEKANLSVELQPIRSQTAIYLSQALCDRWFAPNPANTPSYRDHLSHRLSDDEIAQIQQRFSQRLCNQAVTWESTTVFIRAVS
ncbi:AAA family ATPase [Phormidesmis priestleyi ULC007]|uniref:Replication-associated recombination protein A n=1 Tax=Phormidesmis priestleyi ULC007 TaxID=1920490 RepID=A0A2T1DJE6_9CYAN|nr:AAA family ATPase [Phormidesmis priestleyi]PSB20607.1 AAA family ATPase [Phormidesmis priestleyi ULC007]PZO54277.1 MAG: AAA family ATPase [Phormidesmis priestleyi]